MYVKQSWKARRGILSSILKSRDLLLQVVDHMKSITGEVLFNSAYEILEKSATRFTGNRRSMFNYENDFNT